METPEEHTRHMGVSWVHQLLPMIHQRVHSDCQTLTQPDKERPTMDQGKHQAKSVQDTQGSGDIRASAGTCQPDQGIQNGNKHIRLCVWGSPVPETGHQKEAPSGIHVKVNDTSGVKLQHRRQGSISHRKALAALLTLAQRDKVTHRNPDRSQEP